jgi:hypothetical protein
MHMLWAASLCFGPTSDFMQAKAAWCIHTCKRKQKRRGAAAGKRQAAYGMGSRCLCLIHLLHFMVL